MASSVNIAENLCEAVDIIVGQKLLDIEFDITKVCKITDASEAKLYKYLVTEIDGGLSPYYAYGTDTKYRKNDLVYVTIPQGDYSQEKIIIGKKVKNTTEPFIYNSPLDMMIDITGNIITNDTDKNKGHSLIANHPSPEQLLKNVIEPITDLKLQGFTRLGLSFEIKNTLADYQCVSGLYGVALILHTIKDARVTDQLEQNIQEDVDYEDYTLLLTESDMIGDPYNYLTNFKQEKIFDISNCGAIIGMELQIYEVPETFKDRTGKLLPYLGFQDTPLKDNIFFDNFSVLLGYSTENFEGDAAVLYSPNLSTTYIASKDVDFHENGDNDKEIYCRWIHKFDDGRVKEIAQDLKLDEDYEIRWYRYHLGAKSADQYSGYYWDRVNYVQEELTIELERIESNPSFLLVMNNRFTEYCGKSKKPGGGQNDDAFDATKVPEYIDTSKYEMRPDKVGNYYINNSTSVVDFTISPSGSNQDLWYSVTTANERSSSFSVLAIEDYTPGEWYTRTYNPETQSYVYSVLMDETVEAGKTLYRQYIYQENWMEIFNSKFIYHPSIQDIHPIGFWEKLTLAYRLYWEAPEDFNTRLGEDNIFVTGGMADVPEWQSFKGESIYNNVLNYSLTMSGTQLLKYVLNAFALSFGEWDIVKDANGLGDFKLKDAAAQAELEAQVRELYYTIDNKVSTVTVFPNKLTYHFTPDITLAEERVKVIILYKNKIIRSNVITFYNDKRVVSQETVEAVSALNIHCEDNSFGDYYIYNPGGQVIDKVDAQEKKTLKAYFNSSIDDSTDLTDFESITWTIPIGSDSMIRVGDDCRALADDDEYFELIIYSDAEEKHPTQIIITRKQRPAKDLAGNYVYTDKGVLVFNDPYTEQWYRIEDFYTAANDNNTISCSIVKDGLTYTTSKKLNFGLQGTSGTDYTLTLDFEDDNFTAFTIGENRSVKVNAHLHNAKNKIDVDLNNVPEAKIVWSWYSQDESRQIELTKPSESDPKASCIVSIDDAAYIDYNYNILQCTVKDFGDYDLTAYKIIPWRSSDEYMFMQGPDILVYDSAGLISFEQLPYDLLDTNRASLSTSLIRWTISYMENCMTYDANYGVSPYVPKIGADGILTPVPFYVKDNTKLIAINAFIADLLVWSNPLLIIQNVYPSPMLNQWNGDLEINEEEGRVMAATLAAGHKNPNNTFSGVIIGEVEDKAERILSDLTGIYGYQQGQMSYALLENGTAFFGTSGKGRIWIDGDESIIKSSSWDNGNTGMKLDLDDGSIILNRIYTNDISDYVIQNPYSTQKLNDDGELYEIESALQMYHRICNSVGYYYYRLYSLDSHARYAVDDYTLALQINEVWNNDELTVEEKQLQEETLKNNNKNLTKRPTHYEPIAWTEYNLTEETYIPSKYFTVDADGTYRLETGDFDENKTYKFPSRYEITKKPYTANQFFVKNTITKEKDNTMIEADINIYDPLETYYVKNVSSANRYMTMGADQAEYPLSIGSTATEGSRGFRVEWDGTVHILDGEFAGKIDAKEGQISGDLKVLGSLNGGAINGATITGGIIDIGGGFFHAEEDNVYMGQWHILPRLQNNSSFYCGSWEGSTTGLSNGASTKANADGTGRWYLWAGWLGSLTNSALSVTSEGISLGALDSAYYLHCHIDKNNQTGIYARFA